VVNEATEGSTSIRVHPGCRHPGRADCKCLDGRRRSPRQLGAAVVNKHPPTTARDFCFSGYITLVILIKMAEVASGVSFAPEVIASKSSTHAEDNATRESSQSSSLSSINAQLISHGWAKKPLNLGKLSEKDHTYVVSVLYELLGASVVRDLHLMLAV